MKAMNSYHHQTVLLPEALEGLAIQPNDHVIDGTLGGGGHTEAILEKNAPNGKVLAIDLDADALEAAQARLQKQKQRIVFKQGNFADIKKIYDAFATEFPEVSGILLDLGVSSHQLKTAARGFSFMAPGPLDMRLGKSESEDKETAASLVNAWPEREIAQVLREYGEERFAGRIAAEIIRRRKTKKFTTTTELAEAIAWAYPAQAKRKSKIHPATKSFQAIRIAINDELGSLKKFLPQALDILKPGGRLAIISFHSLEDRIVKNFFRDESRDCLCPPEIPACQCGHTARLRRVTKSPITPSEAEQDKNRASRSAKLRVAEKI